jgi:hypothetical protein
MLKFFVVHKGANMKTGGPAFPIKGPVMTSDEQGMTLRDYFAAKAMQALAQGNYFDATARQAYMIADAMLREREK